MSKRIDLGPGGEPPRRRRSPEPEYRHEPRGNAALRDRLSLGIGIALIGFGIFTGFVAFTMFRAHTLNPIAGVVNYFVPSPESVFGKERVFVLLMGLDYDYDNKDNPTSKDSRTDKIEAFALDFPTKVIKSVAIPRDLDSIVQGHEDKINDAYHYGGWRNTDAAVGKVLAMQPTESGSYFDRYLTLRINASKDLINAIGGLDVPVTQAMDYDDNWGHLHIHFKPGVVHMDGDMAVSYARFRHDACSDPCRIKRQQQIEKLAIAKLKADRLNDLTHIGQLIDVVRRDVDTNLTVDEMRSLGWYFRDLNVADIHGTQIPYSSDKELACCGDVLIADTDGVTKVVSDFLGPYQMTLPSPSAGDLATVKPAAISIAILNGSGVSGLGKKLADQLRADGYIIKHVGNADSFDYDVTVLRTHTATPLAGERLRNDIRLAGATITPAPETSPSGTDVTVVIGRDYADRARNEDVTRPRWVPVIVLVVFAVVAYGAYRLYVRSLPPPPAVVLHDTDLDRALGMPPGERLQRALGHRAAPGPRLVALTFDDGPYPVATPELLAVLQSLHVRATFFLIGRDAEQYPGLVRAIAAGGHEIGDHTQTHPDLDQLDDAAVTAELHAGAATLARIADQPTIHRFFRPPHGRYTRATLRAAQAAGFDTILWTDDPGDWRNVPAAALAAHVARFATSPEILLLHNGRDATMAMLPGVVERFRQAGYTFVTVGELLGRVSAEQLDRAARTPLPAAR